MSRKKILIIAIFVLAGILALAMFYAISVRNQKPADNTAGTSTNDDGINYSPTTETEKAETDQHKENLVAKSDDEAPEQSAKNTTPLITSYGQTSYGVEVGSRVPNVLEVSGKCILELRKDGKVVSETKNASQNVTEMSCGIIKIANSRLNKGTWKATITYQSDKHKGSSASQEIVVK